MILALRFLAWLLEGPMGLAKWLCSLWRHTKEITGQIPLCHHSCSLASITLLSRVGMIKLVLFVFQGFLYFKGVVGSDRCVWSPARSGRRMFPGEFLTVSPHPSAGKTYPRRLHFHNNPNRRSPGEANVWASDTLLPLKWQWPEAESYLFKNRMSLSRRN